MNCPLCQSKLTLQLVDNFYDCTTCFAIVKDKYFYLSVQEEMEFYRLHNNDVEDIGYQQFTSPITQYVLDNFATQHKGLDFGSGTGPVITSMLAKNGFKYIQLYDPFFAKNDYALQEIYDFIFSCEVVEHFHHPLKEYNLLFGLLKEGGKLCIMTDCFVKPRSDFPSWYYKNDPTHVFIHRKETFDYIAKQFGAKIVKQEGRLTVMEKQSI
jgi:SAM-dependent methyltransferase